MWVCIFGDWVVCVVLETIFWGFFCLFIVKLPPLECKLYGGAGIFAYFAPGILSV